VVSEETRQALLSFRREREWEQFHSPKNLAIAISIEAAELLEEFRWTAGNGLEEGVSRAGVERELADVLILSLYLAHDLGVDLNALVRSKLEANAVKYPVDVSRGKARPESSAL